MRKEESFTRNGKILNAALVNLEFENKDSSIIFPVIIFKRKDNFVQIYFNKWELFRYIDPNPLKGEKVGLINPSTTIGLYKFYVFQ